MKRRDLKRELGVVWGAIGLSFFLTNMALAQVTSFGAQKTTFYNQAADNTAPTTPLNYSVLGFVNTTSTSEATSFTLSDNGSLNLTSTAGNPTSFSGNQFYATKSALDAAFTAGDRYSFLANGGSLAGRTGRVDITSDAYAPILYLTGTSFSDAKMVNPNTSFTFSISFTAGSVTDNLRSFSLYDPSGLQVYTANYAANTTTFTVSQATIASLQRGVTYTAALDNFNTSSETGTNYLAGVANATGFVTATDFPFIVIPEPSSIVLLSLGLLGLIAVKDRRRVKLKAPAQISSLAGCNR